MQEEKINDICLYNFILFVWNSFFQQFHYQKVIKVNKKGYQIIWLWFFKKYAFNLTLVFGINIILTKRQSICYSFETQEIILFSQYL
jgi:hypothetical protein